MSSDTVEIRESRFVGLNGASIYWCCWRSCQPPRAVLAIAHGVAEHAGRYSAFANRMATEGFLTCAFDMRGHGKSAGRRGHIDAWEDYRADLERFLQTVAAAFPSDPVFLFGHSMGALVALDFIMRQPTSLKGAIVCGAPIMPSGVGNPFLIAAARIFSLLWPTLELPLGLDATALSRDPAVVEAYDQDPLILRRMTARWGAEALAAVEWVKAQPRQVAIPLLIIHGGADRLNLPGGARYLFDHIHCPDKRLNIYSSSLHEPLNDLDHDRVERDMLEWLAARLLPA